MNETALFWLAAIAASFFVGGSKGGLPMIALLSVPIMSLVMAPMKGAALLLPVYLVSDVYGIWIYRHSFSPRNLAILIPASALGILAGYLLAGRTDEDMVRVVIGVIGLSFLVMRLRARFLGLTKPRPADIPRGVLWGSVSGFTSFVSHAGGPAWQLYALPQQMPKMMFAGTSTILFAVINLMKVPPYLALGLIEWGDMKTVAMLAPVAIFGAWLGYRITRIIPEKVFFTIVEIALFVISVNLIRVGLT
ncbi:MAG: putative permease [Rhodobacteraceae bacterium HLUCCA08]|nr:MAG: putative permease [Rhodobacteraceae bacterium HLUCCA08]